MAGVEGQAIGRSQKVRSFAAARGLALFIAGFCALNLISYLSVGNANQNGWWIDLSFLPQVIVIALEALTSIFLIWFVISPHAPRWRLLVSVILCGILALISAQNGVAFYNLLAQGVFRSGFPFPFSFFVCAGFIYLIFAFKAAYYLRRSSPRKLRTAVVIILTFLVSAFVFPCAQILCFGMTDYRQPVDTVVVLGAQVYPSGGLSPALQERVDTAIELYDQGLTPTLIMSGGTDIDGVNEAEAMRSYAVGKGVPTADILLDSSGFSTEATAHNTTQICVQQGFKTVGVVSTYYHLPRIKQLFLSEGINVYTVPARLDNFDPYLFNVVREVPGWWFYWLKGLVP